MLSQANLLPMKYHIFGRFLNFMKYVFNQDPDNLAKEVLTEQLENGWDGPSKDAITIQEMLGITGVFDPEVSKDQYKKTVKEACIKSNDEDLKIRISEYKKMGAFRDEIEKGNKYFFSESLENVRTLFKFRVDLFPAKRNFKENKEFKKENYMCDSCMTTSDENLHVLNCISYKSLRNGLDINNDSHLAWYLQKVIEIRSELRINR